MRTISGREIDVKANHCKRTFTIRVSGSKYRTCQMSEDEFSEAGYRKGNDWDYFLKHTNNYFLVK